MGGSGERDEHGGHDGRCAHEERDQFSLRAVHGPKLRAERRGGQWRSLSERNVADGSGGKGERRELEKIASLHVATSITMGGTGVEMLSLGAKLKGLAP